ncbi:transporter substrate-binding domain-containing protein [Arthrobacter sp.]|uniref:substrate-binding periplasmic protein n=1 Tax=Arthrobacter sp. TaxID=1667 RepID=UPI003391D9E6
MKFTRKLSALLPAVILVAGLTGCGGAPDAGATATIPGCTPAHPGVQTITPGVLDVSVYVSPPYSTQNGTAFGGIDGAIIKKLAGMECLTLKEEAVAGAGLIAGIQAKRADLAIGGVKYTAQRAQTLALSSAMYQDGVAFIAKNAVDGSLAELSGKSVGVLQGYFFVGDLTKALGADHVRIYQDVDSMLSDIRNGRLDVGTLDNATATYFAKANPGLTATPVQATSALPASEQKNTVVLAINKDLTNLHEALSADIATLIKGGYIARVLKDNGMDPALAGGTNH